MAKTKRLSPQQMKIKVLEMIQETGIRTEKELLALSPAAIVKSMPDVSTEEFRIICDMQESIREKKLFSYLCSD